MNKLKDALTADADRMENICIETADRYKYIYWIAVAVLDILRWIERKERTWKI